MCSEGEALSSFAAEVGHEIGLTDEETACSARSYWLASLHGERRGSVRP